MIVDNGKYYLYRHIRLDKNEVFYVGIGTKRIRLPYHLDIYSRAYDIISRNNLWKNIVTKTNYEIEIVLESDDLNFIKEKEIEFIKLYGRRDLGKGTLCNFSNGGEGSFGRIVTNEEKIKMSERTKLRHLINPESFNIKGKIRKPKITIKRDRKSKISLSKKESILDLINKGINIKEIKKLTSSGEDSIRKLMIENGYSLERYRVKRSDGLKFKTEKEACEYVGLKKGAIHNAYTNNIISKGFKWEKINEYIKI